jgi:hypothetical protein
MKYANDAPPDILSYCVVGVKKSPQTAMVPDLCLVERVRIAVSLLA